jgi:zinc protease
MLEEGTQRHSGTELQDELDGLGAELSIRPDDDHLRIELAVLNEHLPRAADLLAEVVRQPRFDEEDFERIRRQRLVDIQTRADRIGEVASEAFAALTYGRETIKGSPEYGTKESIGALSRDDVRRFWREHVHLQDATLSIVGDRDAAGCRELFARLVGAGETPTPPAPEMFQSQAFPKGIRLHIVDKPGAAQSELRIGHRALARTDPDFFPLFVLNYMLGGSFTSRLNLNLRENKGYTYAVHSNLTGGLTPGNFVVGCAVETAVTGPAVSEVITELKGIHEGVKASEVDFTRRALAQAIGCSLESAHARLGMLENIARYSFPEDYTAQRIKWLATFTAADMDALAARYLEQENLICLIAGDKDKVAPQLEALGLGPVREAFAELEPV